MKHYRLRDLRELFERAMTSEAQEALLYLQIGENPLRGEPVRCIRVIQGSHPPLVLFSDQEAPDEPPC